MAVEKVPRRHLEHEVASLETEYFPGVHTGHLMIPDTDDCDEVPAVQASQTVDPALWLWVPPEHGEHVVEPVEPE